MTGPKTGGRSALTGFRDDNRDIYLGDLVGDKLENIKRLTTDTLRFRDAEPAWSPDGRHIAYTTNREDVNNDGVRDSSIYVMKADGSNQRRLTPNIGQAMEADWCSNGKIAFAYIDFTSNTTGIATINEDSSGFTKIVEETITASIPGWPSWSPDCSQIAFMTHRNNNWEIYRMDSNGSNQTNITNNLSLDQQPSWSPDGNKIAFMSDRDTLGQAGQFNLYLMNPYETGVERLTDFSGGEFDLSWFSDSNRVAFTRETSIGAPLQIYKMNKDGSGLVQLTTEGQNFYPAWRPR